VKGLGILGAAVAVVFALPLIMLMGFAPSATASASPAASGASLGTTLSSVVCSLMAVQVGDAVPGGTLTADQYANAQAIYTVALALTNNDQAPLDAIVAAFSASDLHLNASNRPAGQVGLFGFALGKGGESASQLANTSTATALFVAKLTQLRSWANDAPATAAAAVLGARATDYSGFVTVAERLTATFAGAAGSCAGDESLSPALVAAAGLPSGFALPADTPSPVRTAVTFALSKVGLPYIYGGVGPDGYDCSGLVMMSYKAAGIALERTTYQQVFEGTAVYSFTDLKSGSRPARTCGDVHR
jgi:cell wall-associated NlpC family hydrolase